MYPLLYKSVIMSAFGRGSRQPFKASTVRLTTVAGAAAGTGWYIHLLLPDIPVGNFSNALLACSLFFIVQLTMFITLLCSKNIITGHRDSFMRLLTTLPIRPYALRLAYFLPSFILALCILLFLGAPLGSLAEQFGIPAFVICVAAMLGAWSAFGILYGLPQLRWPTHILFTFGVLGAEYKLLQYVYGYPGSHSLLVLILFWTLAVALSMLFMYRLVQPGFSDISITALTKTIRPKPTWMWFVNKLVRASITRIGLVTAVTISCLVAVGCMWQHAVSPELFSGIGALLLASFASDVRVTSRRNSPPEIVSLQGSLYFSIKQIAATSVLALCIVLPMGILVATQAAPLGSLLQDLPPLLFGIGTGIFFGTLLAPGPRDIRAQLVTILFAIVVLALPYSPWVSLGRSTFDITLVLFAILLLAGSVAIEYARNTFVWKKHA